MMHVVIVPEQFRSSLISYIAFANYFTLHALRLVAISRYEVKLTLGQDFFRLNELESNEIFILSFSCDILAVQSV